MDRPESLDAILKEIFSESSGGICWSGLMSGIADDLDKELKSIYQDFIGQYEQKKSSSRRDDTAVWEDAEKVLAQAGPFKEGALERGRRVQGQHYVHTFPAAWQNGSPQVLEAVSFDYTEARTLVEKANTWSGRLLNLGKGATFQMTARA